MEIFTLGEAFEMVLLGEVKTPYSPETDVQR